MQLGERNPMGVPDGNGDPDDDEDPDAVPTDNPAEAPERDEIEEQ